MLRLENPNPSVGVSTFEFTAGNGVRVSKFDPGYPEVRTVVDKQPLAHGTTDYSYYFGARTINIEFRIFPGWSPSPKPRRQILDELRSLCNPSIRAYLYEAIDGYPERRIMVRPDMFAAPFEMPHTNAVQLSLVAPLGLWESAALYTAEMYPGSGGAMTTGRAYPRTFDTAYAPRTPAGGQVVTNNGSIESYPAIIIYGPLTALTLANETQDKQIEFNSITLAQGESVVVNMKDHQIYRGDQPALSLYDDVDWTNSSWFTLSPGENLLSFNPTGYTETTKMTVAFRYNWI